MFDEPLFSPKPDKGDTTSHEELSLEEYNNREENNRKNRILNFGFSSVLWILIFAAFLIIVDLVAQANGLDSGLIEKCLGLIEYIVAAALGFIFGRSKSD